MTAALRLANGLFDACLAVPGALGENAQIAAVALFLGLVPAAAFHLLADRPGLRAGLGDLRASLLEIWLYRHDPVLVLRAEWELVRANGRCLRKLLGPLALSAAVAAPALVQSWHRFGLEPLSPETDLLLTAERQAGAGDSWPELVWAEGRGEVTAVVREPSVDRIVWRLLPLEPGIHTLHLSGPLGLEAFPLFVGAAPGSIAGSRESSPWRLLIHPRGQPLPAGSGLRRIWVEYPRSGAERLLWPGVLSVLAACVTYGLMDRRQRTHPAEGPATESNCLESQEE